DDEPGRVVQLRFVRVSVRRLDERVLDRVRTAHRGDGLRPRRLERPLELLVVLPHRAALRHQRVREVCQLLQPDNGTVHLLRRFRNANGAHLPQGAPPFQRWYPRIRHLPVETCCETALSVPYRAWPW